MVYDLAQHVIRQLTFTRNRDFNPVFSSDGKYLFFSSNDDGTSRIWRIPVSGDARAEPLFLEAVSSFLPSADGRWLYFLEEGNTLVLARRSLLDGSTQEIFRTTGRPTFVDSLAISGGRIFLAVSQNDLSASDVFKIDPEKRTSFIASHLKDLPPLSASSISGYSVSPDGHILIVDRTVRNTSELYTLKEGLIISAHP
jgi:WD40 repeat protein